MKWLLRGVGGLLSGAIGLACASLLAASAPAATVGLTCPHPSFDGKRDVVETALMEESQDPCWWLSSGAMVSIDRGVAHTLQGELAPDSEWRKRYAESSPVDTDEGAHPQNLLRLVARSTWGDARQEVRFRINRINLSTSRERGEWSGVLLFLRYHDSETLYYAGLRMDGTAVIKKKLEGRYVTLAQRPVYELAARYDRDANPSLLPVGKWIALASVIRTEHDGSVRIDLFVQDERSRDEWRLAASATDRGADGPAIVAPGHAGLRADFMDVEFAGYTMSAVR